MLAVVRRLCNSELTSDIPSRYLKNVFPEHARLGAGTYNCSCSTLFIIDLIKHGERRRFVSGNSCAFFDLYGIQNAIFFDDQINFTFNLYCRLWSLRYASNSGVRLQ